MALPQFDASQSVKFDIARGSVELQGAGPRLLVPPDALLDLCKHAGEEALRDFGRRLGTEAGRRMQELLGRAADTASIEGFVDHLGGNLALLGLGSLSVERWGRALVFVIEGCPLGSAGDTLLGAVLEGAVQRCLGRDAHMVPLERDDKRVRLLATSSSGATKAKALLAQGVKWGDVLSRMHDGGSG
jgi:hypothetical protein